MKTHFNATWLVPFYVKQQLSVKEFYLKIIPWRLFTFRVCPGTKVSRADVRKPWRTAHFHLVWRAYHNPLLSFQFTYYGPDPVHKYLTLVVDDGIQPPVELSCKDRNIMAATFIRFLHKNIGSFESTVNTATFVSTVLLIGTAAVISWYRP